jgi:hypothetical protein
MLTVRRSAASFRARSSRSTPRPPTSRSRSPTRHESFSRPPPPALSFPLPARLTVSPSLPHESPLPAQFSPDPVWPVWSIPPCFPGFPSQLLGTTIRSSVILYHNTSARTLRPPFDPQANSIRWNLLPPYTPPRSLTCQVDMSSSPAPLGVCLTHSSLPLLYCLTC